MQKSEIILPNPEDVSNPALALSTYGHKMRVKFQNDPLWKLDMKNSQKWWEYAFEHNDNELLLNTVYDFANSGAIISAMQTITRKRNLSKGDIIFLWKFAAACPHPETVLVLEKSGLRGYTATEVKKLIKSGRMNQENAEKIYSFALMVGDVNVMKVLDQKGFHPKRWISERYLLNIYEDELKNIEQSSKTFSQKMRAIARKRELRRKIARIYEAMDYYNKQRIKIRGLRLNDVRECKTNPLGKDNVFTVSHSNLRKLIRLNALSNHEMERLYRDAAMMGDLKTMVILDEAGLRTNRSRVIAELQDKLPVYTESAKQTTNKKFKQLQNVHNALRYLIDTQRKIEWAQKRQANQQLLNLDYNTATPEQVEKLIKVDGADVNTMRIHHAKDFPRYGDSQAEETPLTNALEAQNYPVFEKLVELGANLSVRMQWGAVNGWSNVFPYIGDWAVLHGYMGADDFHSLDDYCIPSVPDKLNTPFGRWFEQNWEFIQALAKERNKTYNRRTREATLLGSHTYTDKYYTYPVGEQVPMVPTKTNAQRYKLENGTILEMTPPTPERKKLSAERLKECQKVINFHRHFERA